MREAENLIQKKLITEFSSFLVVNWLVAAASWEKAKNKKIDIKIDIQELWLYDQADWPSIAHCKREKQLCLE